MRRWIAQCSHRRRASTNDGRQGSPARAKRRGVDCRFALTRHAAERRRPTAAPAHAELVFARQHHHPLVPGVLQVELDGLERKVRKGDVLAVKSSLRLAPVVDMGDGLARAFRARQLEPRKIVVNLVQHAPRDTQKPKRPGVFGEVPRPLPISRGACGGNFRNR